MLKIYGSRLCPDCVQCCADLTAAEVAYEYLDFGDSLKALKEFLAIRDAEAQFGGVRADGKIGIPCIVAEDGTVSLTWQQFM